MGNGHTCALYRDGHIGCHGLDDRGQAEPPAGRFTAVVAASRGTCALGDDHHARCWGIADTSDVADVGEEPLSPPPDELTMLAAGGDTVCGLRPDGRVLCWGRRYGEVAGDVVERSKTTPFASIAASAHDLCGVTRAGELACQSAVGHKVTTPPPGPFAAISVGGGSACAIDRAGAARCFGECEDDGCAAPAGAFTRVEVGDGLGCGLRADGTVACWGKHARERGLPSDGRYRSLTVHRAWACGVSADGGLVCPSDRLANLEAFATLTAAQGYLCGIEARDGDLRCWDDTGTEVRTDPPSGAFKAVAPSFAGGGCGLRRDGSVTCWQPPPRSGKLFRVPAPSPGPFTQLVTNGLGYCGLRPEGAVACWGEVPGSGPFLAPPGTFTKIAMAGVHLLAERPDGHVIASSDTCCIDDVAVRPRSVCGGPFRQCLVDEAGELSCGNLHPNSAWGPMRKLGGGYLEASCNDGVTCALRQSGEAECLLEKAVKASEAARWRPPPGPFTHLAVASDFACGLRKSGALACWGNLALGR